MSPKPHSRAPIGLAKKIGFSIFTFIFLAFFFEMGLRISNIGSPGNEDAYAGFAKSIPLFVETRDFSGQVLYETSLQKRRFFNEQRFKATKEGGKRRLFCIGGSTTYGRPFDDATSFCGWLRGFLKRVDPEREWEVVNAGGISYASYRAAAVMREIAQYEPDVFVIYTGHNEFLEKRTWSRVLELPEWLREIDARLSRTHSYTLVDQFAKQVRSAGRIPGEVDALLDNTVGLDAYERDPELRERVLEEFEVNLENMVRTARSAGAEPILVVPASNAKDCSPFKSQFAPSLDADSRARWLAHHERGRKAFLSGDLMSAQAELERAVEIDPLRADGQYWLGRTHLALGNEARARRHLDRALEEDVCPLRALGAVAKRVRSVADSEKVTLVDYPVILSQHSSEPFGKELFLDHVHPTIEAHGILALEIAGALHDTHWVPRKAEKADFDAVDVDIRSRLDPKRQGRALRNLAKVLSWSGKLDDAARAARSAIALLGNDAESEFILGDSKADAGDFEAAVSHYRAAVVLEPDYTKALNNMGIALSRSGKHEQAIAAYRRVLELDPEHGGARFNLANAYLRAGFFEKATMEYRNIVDTDWSDLDAHFNLARAHYSKGDLDSAESHLRVVLENDPEAHDARQQLALVLNQRDRKLEPKPF